MGINLITFYNSTVTPPDDALIYEKALPGSGMIYGGTVTIKNANTLHVAAGHGALCGRKFTIEETDVTVVLTSSGTLNGRLYIHMDLSDTDEPISFQVERAATLTPVIQQDNVNINDGIYEINLATFSISTSTVSNLVNVAPFIDDEVLETIIAPVELTSTASRNYGVGAHLIYKKVLYRVTSAITTGGTITPGSNVTVSNAIVNQIEDLNSSVATINNNKANQTVIATRQANLTASRAYAVGDQFIYNNILYKATAAIASGSAITIGGNAAIADDVTTQISNLTKNQLGNRVDLLSYSASNLYTVPSDGYVYILADTPTGTNAKVFFRQNGTDIFNVGAAGNGSSYGRNALFVKKGMTIYATAEGSGFKYAFYYPLI